MKISVLSSLNAADSWLSGEKVEIEERKTNWFDFLNDSGWTIAYKSGEKSLEHNEPVSIGLGKRP